MGHKGRRIGPGLYDLDGAAGMCPECAAEELGVGPVTPGFAWTYICAAVEALEEFHGLPRVEGTKERLFFSWVARGGRGHAELN